MSKRRVTDPSHPVQNITHRAARASRLRGLLIPVIGLSCVAGVALSAGAAAAPYSASGPVSIYPVGSKPAESVSYDHNAVELGVRFTVSTGGSLSAIKFYKAAGNVGTHTGALWSPTGSKLAAGTFTAESSTGWQTLTLAKPVTLQAGADYVASYHTSVGRYSETQAEFNGSRTVGNSIIQASAGIYAYGARTVLPTQSWRATGYGVDVIFRPVGASSAPSSATTAAPATTAPTTTAPTTAAPTTAAPTTAAPTTTAPTTTAPKSSTAPSTTAAPRPTPTGSTTTAPIPVGGKPGPDTTGVPAGTALTTVNGNVTVSTAGTTISGQDIKGFLIIQASNVTVKNTWVEGGTATGNGGVINIKSGTGILLDHVKVTVAHPSVSLDGIWGQNFTGKNLDISGGVDGMKINDNTTIQNSYIHGLTQFSSDPNQGGGPTHNDAIQILDGANILIQGNDLAPTSSANSAIQVTQDYGAVTNLRVQSNWADGGGCTFNFAQKVMSSMAVTATNNRFGHDSGYANCPVLIGTGVTLTQSGNVFDDTGKPISIQQH